MAGSRGRGGAVPRQKKKRTIRKAPIAREGEKLEGNTEREKKATRKRRQILQRNPVSKNEERKGPAGGEGAGKGGGGGGGGGWGGGGGGGGGPLQERRCEEQGGQKRALPEKKGLCFFVFTDPGGANRLDAGLSLPVEKHGQKAGRASPQWVKKKKSRVRGAQVKAGGNVLTQSC